MPDFEKIESAITPEQEMGWAQEAAEEGDWAQVGENLNEVAKKTHEAEISQDRREKLKTQLAKIEALAAQKEVPRYALEGIERAKAVL